MPSWLILFTTTDNGQKRGAATSLTRPDRQTAETDFRRKHRSARLDVILPLPLVTPISKLETR